jgi:threonine dehydratase
MKNIERYINSPEEIVFGLNLGEYQGNSTITEVYIKSDSMENEEVSFKIRGSIEREGLIFIFKTLSEILKIEKDKQNVRA